MVEVVLLDRASEHAAVCACVCVYVLLLLLGSCRCVVRGMVGAKKKKGECVCGKKRSVWVECV